MDGIVKNVIYFFYPTYLYLLLALFLLFYLQRYLSNFSNEHIGMLELPYMTEERLQSIGIPMGPRLRILQESQLCFRQENFNIYII